MKLTPLERRAALSLSAEDLQEIANAAGRGYLKFWKAASMLATLRDIPGIASDETRLRKWVANCLEMEGFTAAGVDRVTSALRERCLAEWGPSA